MRLRTILVCGLILNLTSVANSFAGYSDRIELLCKTRTTIEWKKIELYRSFFLKSFEFACPEQLETLAQEVVQQLGKDIREVDFELWEGRFNELQESCKNAEVLAVFSNLVKFAFDKMADELMDEAQKKFDEGLEESGKKKVDLSSFSGADEDYLFDADHRSKEAQVLVDTIVSSFDPLMVFDRLEISPKTPLYQFMTDVRNYMR